MTDEQQARYVQALLVELDALEKAGKDERADAVRAELKRLGRSAQTPQRRAEKRPAAKRESR